MRCPYSSGRRLVPEMAEHSIKLWKRRTRAALSRRPLGGPGSCISHLCYRDRLPRHPSASSSSQNSLSYETASWGMLSQTTWQHDLFGPTCWQYDQEGHKKAYSCNTGARPCICHMLLCERILLLDIILAVTASIQPFALPGAGLQMHWKTMGAMRRRKTTTMMMQWTANCSTPPVGRR